MEINVPRNQKRMMEEIRKIPDPNQTEGATLQPMPPEGEILLSWFSPGTIAGHNTTASSNEINEQLPFVWGGKEEVISNEGTDMVMRVVNNTKKGEMSISNMEVASNIHENDRAVTPSIGTVGKPADELSKDDICALYQGTPLEMRMNVKQGDSTMSCVNVRRGPVDCVNLHHVQGLEYDDKVGGILWTLTVSPAVGGEAV